MRIIGKKGHVVYEFPIFLTYRGEWEIGFDKVLGQDVRGSTVGIVGLGGIGQAVVKRLAGFEVEKFVYSGHREKPEGMKQFLDQYDNTLDPNFSQNLRCVHA